MSTRTTRGPVSAVGAPHRGVDVHKRRHRRGAGACSDIDPNAGGVDIQPWAWLDHAGQRFRRLPV